MRRKTGQLLESMSSTSCNQALGLATSFLTLQWLAKHHDTPTDNPALDTPVLLHHLLPWLKDMGRLATAPAVNPLKRLRRLILSVESNGVFSVIPFSSTPLRSKQNHFNGISKILIDRILYRSQICYIMKNTSTRPLLPFFSCSPETESPPVDFRMTMRQ